MTEKEIRIGQKIHNAEIALDDAFFLADNERFQACSNRLYYSLFYLVDAYAAQNEIRVKTHKSIRSIFHLQIAHKGLTTRVESKYFDQVFDLRISADYTDLFETAEEVILDLLSQSQSFHNKLKQIILTP